MELKGRVVGENGVRGQLGGDQVGVYRIGIWVGSRRDDREQPAPDPDQASPLRVVGKERFLGSCSSPANSSPVNTGCWRKKASCLTVGIVGSLSRYPGLYYVHRDSLSLGIAVGLDITTNNPCVYYVIR